MIAQGLALDGGSPVRASWLPFHRPRIEEDEIAEVVDTLRGGWLTTGPRAKRFEREFCDYVGAQYGVAVNSATAAMHLGLEAIGIRPGDEVIVPAYTFTATAEVVLYFEATPVIVDVDPVTFNIDPAAVEAAITDKTKAIMPVDMAGLPCEYDALRDIAKRHNLVPHIYANVEAGSTVHTDALRSYRGLDQDYTHNVIDHAEAYADGQVHTNGLENFWSLLKRAIKGTYVSVMPFHLFRYLDEQAFRFNNRTRNDAERFALALRGIIDKRLTYKALTGAELAERC